MLMAFGTSFGSKYGYGKERFLFLSATISLIFFSSFFRLRRNKTVTILRNECRGKICTYWKFLLQDMTKVIPPSVTELVKPRGWNFVHEPCGIFDRPRYWAPETLPGQILPSLVKNDSLLEIKMHTELRKEFRIIERPHYELPLIANKCRKIH